jgi:hypothetical protein
MEHISYWSTLATLNARQKHKCKEGLSQPNGEVGLEKTKYMVVSHHQNAEQNYNLLISNKSFEM